MAKNTPVQFFKQVRQEANKVTWPNRRETVTSTIMVLVMLVIVTLFFFLVDEVFATAVKWLFGLGS